MLPLQQSVEPLKSYLATYETYLDFLRLDVDAYVAQAEEKIMAARRPGCPRTSATS